MKQYSHINLNHPLTPIAHTVKHVRVIINGKTLRGAQIPKKSCELKEGVFNELSADSIFVGKGKWITTFSDGTEKESELYFFN